MKLKAFFRLLNRRIESANTKAQNPFIDARLGNPFTNPIYTTLVWIEPDDDPPMTFRR